MPDAKQPSNWPEGFIYSRQCVSSQLHPSLLEEFTSTGKAKDREVNVPLIDQGIIHPQIKLEKITPHLKFLGKHPHPLSHTPYGKRPQYGVFARGGIDSGVEIGEYVGELQLMAADWKHNLKDFDHAWTLRQGPFLFVLNAKKVANELAFTNDYRGLAEEPNTKPKWVVHRGCHHLILVTINRVKPQEELLIDYGEGYWQSASRRALIK